MSAPVIGTANDRQQPAWHDWQGAIKLSLDIPV
jgi:hypothetical protein